MLKKFTWVIVCCLMVISLVGTSCSTTDTGVIQEEDEQEEVKIEVIEGTEEQVQDDVVTPEKEMVRNAAGNMVEKPVYGGTLNLYQPSSPGI